MMARISVVRHDGYHRITLKGRLTASDLRRLERACGSALEHKSAPLKINIERVLSIDTAAAEYLERLRKRGAHIRGNLDGPPRVRPVCA
jgi:translation initiation factor IF-2